MADRGAEYADKRLSQIDRELRATYKKAQKELQAKLTDFNRRHKEKDAEKRKQLRNGEISKQQYQDWLAGQTFMRKQWERKIDQVSQVMLHHNEQAAKIINESRLDVFAENYYSEAFKANWILQDAGFNVYSTHAIARLLKDNPQILPEWKIDEEKDYKWNYQKVNNIVRQGIIQGEGVEQITERLCTELCTQNENRMRMFARTAITGAQSAGRQVQMEQAAANGIQVHKQWLATLDSRTRDAHIVLDGQEVPYNEDFESPLGEIEYPGDPSAAPANVYNCRCTMVTIYPEYEDRSKNWREDETIDGVPYEEWKEAAKERIEEREKGRASAIIHFDEPSPVDGKDLTGKWSRRVDRFDFEIEDVMEAQGFDGKPKVVSREEFEKAVQESGFIAQRTYSAPDQETLDEYKRMLYYGKWYVDCSEGGAQYGQGMYCAASWTGKLTKGITAEMEHYQELARKKANSEVTTWGGMKVMSPIKGSQKTVVSRVETITLAPDAKVITYKELVRMRQEEKEKALSTMTEEQYMAWKEKQPGDIGAYAAMKGYDAINAEGHGESGSYTVILNRTKCIILGD